MLRTRRNDLYELLLSDQMFRSRDETDFFTMATNVSLQMLPGTNALCTDLRRRSGSRLLERLRGKTRPVSKLVHASLICRSAAWRRKGLVMKTKSSTEVSNLVQGDINIFPDVIPVCNAELTAYHMLIWRNTNISLFHPGVRDTSLWLPLGRFAPFLLLRRSV